MSEKKKRKASEASASATKQVSKEESYEDIMQYEENEAKSRQPEQDMKLFHATCEKLKLLFSEMAQLKKESTAKSKAELVEKQRQGAMHFVLLKKMNRLEKYRIKAGRNALQKEKVRVDSNRLHLQNLLYEASHLKREIHHCYLFKSQDEDIELIPEDEFYSSALESIARPDKTKADEHAKRLARLEWELHQRKELSAMCKELTVQKETVSKEISKKMEQLNSLAPCLKTLLKATKPLQTALEMEIGNEIEVQKIVKLLPRPLYMVYVNISAYAEACESKLKICIQGDEEEAQIQDEDEKSEHEDVDSDLEEIDVKPRKKHSRYNKVDQRDDNKKKALAPHPLYVTFTLTGKMNMKSSLSVTLRYFPELGFVTAVANCDTESAGIIAGELLSSENILNCLFPLDYGDCSPNPKTKYQLQTFDLLEEETLQQLKDDKFGKPYEWCQQMCGIEFLDVKQSANSGLSSELIQNTVPEVIKRLKNRWKYRLSLFKQVCALENKNLDLFLCEESYSRVRISSSLVQWTTLTWEDYSAHPVTQKIVESNCVNCHDIFYRTVVTRGSAKLECLVSIPPDYPVDSPMWVMCLSWNGIHNAGNNPAIKEMEFWTNSLTMDALKDRTTLLSAQLSRTMSSLDIFLETEGPLYSPAEFTQDKTFLKPFSKRTQSRPYRLNDNGNVIFKPIA